MPAIRSWFNNGDEEEDWVSDDDDDIDDNDSGSESDTDDVEASVDGQKLADTSTSWRTTTHLSDLILNDENAKRFRSNHIDERITRLTEASIALLLDDAMKM